MPTDTSEHLNPRSTTVAPARTNAVQNRTQSNTVEQGRTTSAPKRLQNCANTRQNLTQTDHPKHTISRKTLDIARSPPPAEKSRPTPKPDAILAEGDPKRIPRIKCGAGCYATPPTRGRLWLS